MLQGVPELTVAEGAVSCVAAQGSSHIMDLDGMTVRRVPGTGRPAAFNDVERPLRTLEDCESQLGR